MWKEKKKEKQSGVMIGIPTHNGIMMIGVNMKVTYPVLKAKAKDTRQRC